MKTVAAFIGVLQLLTYSEAHKNQFRNVYTNLQPMDHFSQNNMSFCFGTDNTNKEYEPWSRQLRIVSTLPWYNTRDLFKALKHMRSMDVCKENEREIALNILNSVPTGAPFARRCRFPEKEHYICEGLYGWEEKFSELRASLTSSNCTLHNSKFYKASSQFYKMEVRGSEYDELIDRYDFEKMFRVYWTGHERPRPPSPTNVPTQTEFNPMMGFQNGG